MRYRSVGRAAIRAVVATSFLMPAGYALAQSTPAEQVSPGDSSPRGLPPEQEPKPSPTASYPRITGAIEIEIENDNTYRTGSGAGERNVLFTDSAATFGFYVNPTISLQTTLHVEPVQDQKPGDRTFDDHGLYLEQLYALYDGERFQAVAGKFNLEFGFAWDRGPGVFGSDFAEDYEFNERLGAGAAVKLGGGDAGTHKIGVQIFSVDNTLLSATGFERRFDADGNGDLRRRNRERYPGVANTPYPTSIAVVATGEDMGFLPGTSYNFGFIREDGDDGARNETGGVFGLEHTHALGEDLSLVLLGEVAGFDQYQGADEDRFYLTGGVGLAYGPWAGSVSSTWRYVDQAAGSAPGHYDDLLFQASVGYTFDLGALGEAGLNLGWKAERVQEEWADTVGLLFTYSYKFGDAP